jgi:Starch-binding associating with outer membrane
MKNKMIKSIFAFAAGVTLVAGNIGCAKIEDFGTINTRTDASAVPVTGYLLTNAEANIASLMTGGIRPALFAQQFAETQYTDVSIYGVPQIDFGGTYAGFLEDVQKIIDLNSDPATKSSIAVSSSGSNGNQLGVAKILRAYIYWTITDRWGDIPYSEALKGAANLSPAYDKQQDIYKDLLKQLKDAITSFDGGANTTGDIFYAGNPAKWKKLANSLRMLIALRMSKADAALAQTEFALAYNDANGAIITNADNMVAPFDGATTLTTNVWYSALNGRKDYSFSLTLHDILNNMGDGRRGAYGTTGAAFPYGLKRDDAVAFEGSVSGNVSRLFNVKTQSTPIVIVPAAYVLLAMAEASDRGWIGGSAQAFYENGVTASFAQWGVSGAAAYLAGPAANFVSGTGGGNNIGANSYGSIVGSDAQTGTTRKRIQLQRYLASYGDGIQAWSEWRRTGVPNLKPTAFGTNTPKEIPRRYTYGVGEYAANPANVAIAVGRLSGGDLMSSKMWWDQ